MNNEIIKKGACWCCQFPCVVKAHLRDDRLIKIEADPNFRGPQTQKLCQKQRPVQEILYNPYRLNFPLKRVGERGEGKWQQISWDQALDEIAEKLKGIKDEYGPEAVLATQGTWRNNLRWGQMRFMNLFGSPNSGDYAGKFCWCNEKAIKVTLAGWASFMDPKPGITKCMVYIGEDTTESFRWEFWPFVQACQRKGAKLIVIDPRHTVIASIADIWLQIRPSTDGALLLSWIHLIIKEQLYDKDFVEKWTNVPFLIRKDTNKMLRESDLIEGGSRDKFVVWDTLTNTTFIHDPDDLETSLEKSKPSLEGTFNLDLVDKKNVECTTAWDVIKENVKGCTPEWAEKITWIPKEKIIESARTFAKAGPAYFECMEGIDQHPNTTDTIRCYTILTILTGNIDREGGQRIPVPDRKKLNFRFFSDLEFCDSLLPEQRKKQIGADKFRIQAWPQYEMCNNYTRKKYGVVPPQVMVCPVHAPDAMTAILEEKPYPVKAWIIEANNPLTAHPNTKRTYKAMKDVDLLVVLDVVMSPPCSLADYVLPMCVVNEKPLMSDGSAVSFYLYSAPAIVPRNVPGKYDRRNEYDFWRGLAVRLGQKEHWPWETLEDVWGWRVKDLGYNSFEEFIEKADGQYWPPVGYNKHEEVDSVLGKIRGFATPTGKCEIWSIVFEELDYAPFPNYVEHPETPVSKPMLAREYPYILLTNISRYPLKHAEFHYAPTFRKHQKYPLLEMHTLTASELGLSEDDWAWVETLRGKIKAKVHVSPGIDKRIVAINHGWWLPEMPIEEPSLGGIWEHCSNVLTEDDISHADPYIGTPALKTMLCKVYPVTEPIWSSKQK